MSLASVNVSGCKAHGCMGIITYGTWTEAVHLIACFSGLPPCSMHRAVQHAECLVVVLLLQAELGID